MVTTSECEFDTKNVTRNIVSSIYILILKNQFCAPSVTGFRRVIINRIRFIKRVDCVLILHQELFNGNFDGVQIPHRSTLDVRFLFARFTRQRCQSEQPSTLQATVASSADISHQLLGHETLESCDSPVPVKRRRSISHKSSDCSFQSLSLRKLWRFKEKEGGEESQLIIVSVIWLLWQ